MFNRDMNEEEFDIENEFNPNKRPIVGVVLIMLGCTVCGLGAWVLWLLGVFG